MRNKPNPAATRLRSSPALDAPLPSLPFPAHALLPLAFAFTTPRLSPKTYPTNNHPIVIHSHKSEQLGVAVVKGVSGHYSIVARGEQNGIRN